MAEPDRQTFDFLTGDEGNFMEPLLKELGVMPWAKSIIDDINANGGLIGKNKAKLFELRFGNALHEADVQPRYEVPGEGASTLDFGFTSGGRDFLVEMVRLEETDAVRAATTTEEFGDGAVMVKRQLSTAAEDPRQSEEGETLKAVQRICQKFESGGKPHKFPPIDAATHVLLVDVRTLFNGGDEWDRAHVGLGGEFVPPGFYRRYYKGNLISGVFSSKTTLRGAAEARERLHFIGFVNEKSFGVGTFGPAIQFIANPNLFKTSEEARAALAGWPLGQPDILNARPHKVRELAVKLSNLTVLEAAELSRLLKDRWNIPAGDGQETSH